MTCRLHGRHRKLRRHPGARLSLEREDTPLRASVPGVGVRDARDAPVPRQVPTGQGPRDEGDWHDPEPRTGRHARHRPGPETAGHDQLDTGVPQSARVYDYLLGGKDNYEADRAVGSALVAHAPALPVMVQAQRKLLARMVAYLVREAGVRQFLDVGTGIPSADNVHEVAQALAPESRVLYVDNDPIVLAHARALMKSTPRGAHRLHPGRPAPAGDDPRRPGPPRRPRHREAGRAASDRHRPPPARRGPPVRARPAPGELAAERRLPRRGLAVRRLRPADDDAGWRRRRSAPGSPTCRAARTSWRGSSRAWSSSSRASCRSSAWRPEEPPADENAVHGWAALARKP